MHGLARGGGGPTRWCLREGGPRVGTGEVRGWLKRASAFSGMPSSPIGLCTFPFLLAMLASGRRLPGPTGVNNKPPPWRPTSRSSRTNSTPYWPSSRLLRRPLASSPPVAGIRQRSPKTPRAADRHRMFAFLLPYTQGGLWWKRRDRGPSLQLDRQGPNRRWQER